MEWVKLGDIAEITMGQSPDSSYYNENGEGLPFYQGVSDFGEVFPSPSKFSTKPKKIAQKGDILIGVRAPVGDINISNEDCCIGRGIASIRPNNKKYSRDFLYFHLLSQNKYLNSQATGSTFKAISRSVLENILVPKITLEVQENIAYTIASIRKLIAKRREQIDDLVALVDSVFYEMFGDPLTESNRAYKAHRLEELVTDIIGGGTPSKKRSDYYGDAIPWITPKDMKEKYLERGKISISDEGLENSSAQLIPRGSLLMVIRSGILKKYIPLAICTNEVTVNQDMKAFVLKQKINVQYLYYYIRASERFLLGKVRSVTADNFNFNDVKNLNITLPPIDLQNRFADYVTSIEAQKESLRASLSELETLFDALMQEAFSGL